MGISILRDGIMVEYVGIMDARDGGVEMGEDVIDSWGEFLEMGEVSSFGEVKIIDGVEIGKEVGGFCDTKGIPLVAKRIWDKLI